MTLVRTSKETGDYSPAPSVTDVFPVTIDILEVCNYNPLQFTRTALLPVWCVVKILLGW